MPSRRTLLTGLLASPFIPSRARAAAPGVSGDAIRFGQAAVFEGPAAELGLGMRRGLLAAFAEANRAGGVLGRKLELVARDDGYEPIRSVEATRALITEGQVFALLGPVGTPTSAAALPVAAEANVPFIGPFTGAEFLRDAAKLSNVVNLRASYFQETEAMVERLIADVGAKRIAILYQDDAFGHAGLAGIQQALAKRNMELAAEGTYERNTVAVRRAVLAIQRARPDAVVMIGAYKPCAEFIKIARQVRLNAVFVNISFVGADPLAVELGEHGAGVVVTQVVPYPRDRWNPIVAKYQAALAAHDPAATPGFISLEGYLVGRMVTAALARAGQPTRADLMAALKQGTYDLDGFRLVFAPGKNQGSDSVWLTVVQSDGSFLAVDRIPAITG